MFWSAGCSVLRIEGFFCNLDVLYGGLGIGKLYFLKKKFWKKSFVKTLDPDPDRYLFSLKYWIRISVIRIRIRNPACRCLERSTKLPQFFLADWLPLRVKAQHGFVDHPQGLLEGLLEVAPDAHDLAHTLHAAPNLGAHPAKLAQVPSEDEHKDD